jgi:hypothetical protein
MKHTISGLIGIMCSDIYAKEQYPPIKGGAVLCYFQFCIRKKKSVREGNTAFPVFQLKRYQTTAPAAGTPKCPNQSRSRY